MQQGVKGSESNLNSSPPPRVRFEVQTIVVEPEMQMQEATSNQAARAPDKVR